MVKKLRLFIISLAINPVLPLLILLPRDSKVTFFPALPELSKKTLATLPTSLPPASPSSSTARPAMIAAVRPSPIVTSQKLQPVSSSSRRREEPSPFPFPATQVFQQRESWPIRVTREAPNRASEKQGSVVRLFRGVY
ncbi:hypothetical protein O181_089524 [Austropuccinia psidii MF-1]|uniref:Uncharacterized protein n=1 Tax=Austropuccinia psidii MF-1 TaxID=1389203 RepID=A0A9Q3ITP7_9BASI|nr:hypothetical protein [Austropuccinia psidii MF-1]